MGEEGERPDRSKRPAREHDPASRVCAVACAYDGRDALAFDEDDERVVDLPRALAHERVRLVGRLVRLGRRGCSKSGEECALFGGVWGRSWVVAPIERDDAGIVLCGERQELLKRSCAM